MSYTFNPKSINSPNTSLYPSPFHVDQNDAITKGLIRFKLNVKETRIDDPSRVQDDLKLFIIIDVTNDNLRRLKRLRALPLDICD